MDEQGGRETAADTLGPLLLGNLPMEQWPSDDHSSSEPWRSFVAARNADTAGDHAGAITVWQAIAAMTGVESRHTLQAWTFLRGNGIQPPAAIAALVLGVIVQVPVDGGRDVLAAYRDGSARYLNRSGKISVVDDGPANVKTAVDAVVAAAQPLADVVGVWEQAALPDLPAEQTRLLMLTPAGFRFGQGPDVELRKEPLADALFTAATNLLVAIVDLHAP